MAGKKHDKTLPITILEEQFRKFLTKYPYAKTSFGKIL
jgi:hypothetical protein